MLKPISTFLLAFSLCASLLGHTIECPHGCGNPNRDKRIKKVMKTIQSCFRQLEVVSQSNKEEFDKNRKLDKNYLTIAPVYFTPLFKSNFPGSAESLEGTLSLIRAEYRSYFTKETLFYRRWKRENFDLYVDRFMGEPLVSKCGLNWEYYNGKKYVSTHLRYSGTALNLIIPTFA